MSSGAELHHQANDRDLGAALPHPWRVAPSRAVTRSSASKAQSRLSNRTIEA